ncbi:MAG: N-acetyltransferase protein [Acidobacteriota bacterium]|nr:N-acetyltransferase protein [Acidobacteriota bacterium]
MSIEIRTVETKKDLKTFVKVPFDIYKGNDCWVPQLIREEMEIFNKKKNPAYDSADSRLFLAYKDGRPVGRIAAILSYAANEKYNIKNLRFGWFDTIDDYEVARALLASMEAWGRELGMETLTGPHGFTDLDPEGMLIEGFDQLATISVYYNHPYYVNMVEKYGFEKEIDYVEFKALPPYEEGIPPKLLRLGDRIKERSGIRILKFKNRRHVLKNAGAIFYLLDEAYEELYGAVPLTEKQINYYVKKYISFADKDLLKLAVDENGDAVGFLVAMPSLSRAFQKAKGRLLPFGWYHILMGLRNYEILDFYLAGIKKKYRGLGVDLLMVLEVVKAAMAKGVKFSESNPELETNKKIQAQWKYFNPTLHKRRRIFKKKIS